MSPGLVFLFIFVLKLGETATVPSSCFSTATNLTVMLKLREIQFVWLGVIFDHCLRGNYTTKKLHGYARIYKERYFPVHTNKIVQ